MAAAATATAVTAGAGAGAGAEPKGRPVSGRVWKGEASRCVGGVGMVLVMWGGL